MAKRTCTVDECSRTIYARGWCSRHYDRWRSYGRLDLLTFEDRFWSKVNKGDPNECWEWNAAQDGRGYGHIQRDGVVTGAHRVAYELSVGPIPDGLHIDHLCRNRLCVNPGHLEPVTPGENVLRGVGVSATQAKRTHCISGHPFTLDNTYVWNGHRRCRACQRDAAARRRSRKRGG